MGITSITNENYLSNVYQSKSLYSHEFNETAKLVSIDVDENGNVVKEHYESGASVVLKYDDHNTNIYEEWDHDSDGNPESIVRDEKVEYDDDGNIRRVIDNRNGDEHTFNEKGQMTSWTYTSKCTDIDGNVIENSKNKTTYEYHENGQLKEKLYTSDNNNDGSVEMKFRDVYDESGKHIYTEYEWDDDGDGKIDSTDYYNYD